MVHCGAPSLKLPSGLFQNSNTGIRDGRGLPRVVDPTIVACLAKASIELGTVLVVTVKILPTVNRVRQGYKY
jgi:hypothetical protein